MTKPAVLHMIAFVNPSMRTILESKYSYFAWWEIQDKEAFLAEKGSVIRGIVTDATCKVDNGVISRLPNLEIISSCSVGVDNVDLDFCKQRGVIVTNTPDVVTDDTADTAMALLLATLRRICAADRFLRDGRWGRERYPLTTKVSGKRIGIVGLGRIGQAIASRAESFGCSIAYFGRTKKQDVHYKYFDNIVDLAEDSDVLIVACSLTKETTGIISREVLTALGSKGFLVNIARGQVVDESQLVEALVEGKLAGAGLDVFESEPNVPKELLSMENVVLLPHVGTSTWETSKAMVDLLVANLEAHFSGNHSLTAVF